MKTASSSPNFNYGFPTPGPQNPTGDKVMDHVFFVSETDWKQVRENEQFDFIVIGSGFCCLAFIERARRNKKDAKILVLERGPFFLPEHFQNLPLPFQYTLGGLSETFPWTLSKDTIEGQYIQWQHGMVPFFGGRSVLWSGWCPRPTVPEMAVWPEEVIKTAHAYFPEAESLLNVIPADKIDSGGRRVDGEMINQYRPVYAVLQKKMQERIASRLHEVQSFTRVIPAPLAVHNPQLHNIDFSKFSTPGKILGICKDANRDTGSLAIATNCLVERVVHQNGAATALETTRGVVNVGRSKVILAMGTLPPATLLQNSFPQVKNIGERFSAHFITAITARVPRADYEFAKELFDLELAAIYVAGNDLKRGDKAQYHIQLSILSDKNPEANVDTALSHMPDVVATASMEQLLSSKDHVVFVCAVLGELDYDNKYNWFRKHNDSDPTVNSLLQVQPNDHDLALWEVMDEGTFGLLEKILSPKGAAGVEYWHNSSSSWQSGRPGKDQIRVPGLVHESSVMHIGEEESAVVGLDYRPKGIDNIYVTGGSLWPAGGSWNPTMTMVALTQHLADQLTQI